MQIFMLFFLTLSLATPAVASGVFRADSKLPAELQAKVLAAVQAKCSAGPLTLQEKDTTEKEERIDFGQTDSYYRTTFIATYLFDDTRPVETEIVVESAELDFSNPNFDRIPVLDVKSTSPGLCE